ncbi:MAG: hypothetical protein EON58_14660, partial [Alphaproteobacteria bacterium]
MIRQIFVFAAICCLVPSASSQKISSDIIAQASVDAVVRGVEARYQAALIKERRIADDREMLAISAADDRLKQARTDFENRLIGSQAKLEQARAAYAVVVQNIAKRDDQVAALLAAYQLQLVGDIAQSSPEMLVAMQRFADGDLVEGERQFAKERTRRIKARQEVSDRVQAQALLANAADARQNAKLLETMRLSGQSTTVEVLAVWTEAAIYNPRDHWTQIERARLLVSIGQLSDGWNAARLSFDLAVTATEKVQSLVEMADASEAGGYWKEA